MAELENRLWVAADKLRANSSYESSLHWFSDPISSVISSYLTRGLSF